MSNDNEIGISAEKTKEDIRKAVELNDDIRSEVRNIVATALGENHLERKNVERTIGAVLDGAIEGSPEGSKELAEVVKKTVAGLDDALAKAASASKLAIEEVGGRVDDFSEQDMKRAIDDLKGLEALFIQTLGDLAKAGHGTAGSILHDLASHAERSGTEIGRSAKEALDALHGALSKTERPHLSDVEKVARTGAASLASVASGILAGLADSLAPEKKSETDKPEQKDD